MKRLRYIGRLGIAVAIGVALAGCNTRPSIATPAPPSNPTPSNSERASVVINNFTFGSVDETQILPEEMTNISFTNLPAVVTNRPKFTEVVDLIKHLTSTELVKAASELLKSIGDFAKGEADTSTQVIDDALKGTFDVIAAWINKPKAASDSKQLDDLAKSLNSLKKYIEDLSKNGQGIVPTTNAPVTPETRPRAVAPDGYVLDAAEIAQKKDFSMTVPSNGIVHLDVVRTNASTNVSTVFLYVGSFYGAKSGRELPVKISGTNLTFGPTQAVAQAQLVTDTTLMTEDFRGTLMLYGADLAPILWRLTLSKGNGLPDGPASLMLTPGKVTCAVEAHLFGKWKTRDVVNEVALLNTNTTWTIEGVAVVPGEMTSGDVAHFSVAKNVDFFINKTSVTRLTQLPPTDEKDAALRRIPPGGQIMLGLGFKGLRAGEYTFELNLRTQNPQDIQQKVTVDLKVADPMWLAVVVLIAALLISFFTYKWLGLYRNRLGLQQRVADLRERLPSQLEIYPAVWARMQVRQAEYLAERLLLSDPSNVTDRLDKAAPVVGALESAERVRSDINRLQPLVRNRFGFVVDRILRQMRTEGMTKAAADKAKGELDQLYQSASTNNYKEAYWEDLTNAVNNLRSNFEEGAQPAEVIKFVKERLDELLGAGTTLSPQSGLEAMTDYENKFARLSLLYQRKWDEELGKKLMAAYEGGLDNFQKMADEAAWKGIRKAANDQKLIIKPPPVIDGRRDEAYQSIEFIVDTGNPLLNETYLFTHLLRFEWRFELDRELSPLSSEPLIPVTSTPSVAQFSPDAGEWTVSAILVCDTKDGIDRAKVPRDVKVSLRKSSAVKLLGNLERSEWWGLAMAGLFALVSGLLTFYYKNPTFGTMQDYLTMFLWGVGVDQAKNFLQSISSPTPAAKPAPSAPPTTTGPAAN